MKGKVYLVGAGPGDPELLTLKALRVLRAADAVCYDDLVSAEILNLAPKTAQILNVGKRCGTKKITQTEINFLMVTLAGAGRQVVRLKSGDPLIFGRAGEELEALRRAGIEYEVIAGVTSVLGAAAATGIPLTHRDHSSALILLTGQNAPNTEETDWRPFVSSAATLVIYMPGQNYSRIAARLRSAGMKPATPCAIVSRATGPDQQVVFATIENLPGIRHLPAPALLVVGEVVRVASCDSEFPENLWDQAGNIYPMPRLHALLPQVERLGREEEPTA
jgi:uroporphyrin-III C-methyltransferase